MADSSIPLAKQVIQGRAIAVNLDEDQERRFQRLVEETTMIDLHQHPLSGRQSFLGAIGPYYHNRPISLPPSSALRTMRLTQTVPKAAARRVGVPAGTRAEGATVDRERCILRFARNVASTRLSPSGQLGKTRILQ